MNEGVSQAMECSDRPQASARKKQHAKDGTEQDGPHQLGNDA
jgi:hypothetical protein